MKRSFFISILEDMLHFFHISNSKNYICGNHKLINMKLNYLLLCGLLTVACQSENEYVIEGTLPQPFTGKLYLTCVKDQYTRIDSVTLNAETSFKLKGTIDNPEYCNLTTSPRQYDAPLIVEANSKYQVNMDETTSTIEVLKGGNEQKILSEYLTYMQPLEEQGNELATQLSNVTSQTGKTRIDSIQKQMSLNFEKREQATKEFIKKYPKSFTACHLAGNLLLYTYPELKEIYEIIDTVKFAYSYDYRQFKENLTNSQSTWMEGYSAPDFITHDLQGKEVRLSDFKGKYLLLDFWASWCRPCRQRASELKAIYDQLQERNIVVCGLSMDEKKAQWEAATKEDGIVWINTGELKPFKQNSIAADYKVVQLPTMYLIDPEGKIIMQNPDIGDLLALPIKK